MQNVVKRRKKVSREGVCGTLFASIPLIGFTIFGLIPMLVAIWMALTNTHFRLANLEWNNFENFKYLFTTDSSLFVKSIGNTFYIALSMPVALVVSLIVSVLLNTKIKAKKLFRTIFFIPYVCSVVAVTLMWKWIFDANYGVVNQIIQHFGGEAINWLGKEKTFVPVLLIMGVWSGCGFNIILFSAALTKVNPSYYEAAQIDGANSWQQFWNVTMPAISPTTFYLLVMGLIGALQEFARVQVMAPNGGPDNAGVTVVFYLYRQAFSYHEMGRASAAAWLLAILIMIITAINFKLGDKWVSYD